MEAFQLLGRIAIDNANAIRAMDDTSSHGEKTEARLSKAFRKIGAVVASAFAVQKIVSFGKTIVNMASEAESAFAKVNTLLAGGTDLNRYFDDIIDASNRTGIAMKDYSEAVYQAISAGVNQNDAVAFVEQAAKLAKGGFTDTATAVDVLTTAINAYGLSAEEAAHLSDVLITTQNLGKTTVAELAATMGRVIPIAAAYGVSVENLGAAYAIMTAGGISTAESTTYLKSMLTELAKDGSTVSNVLKQRTGRSFSDLMKAGLSLGEVLGILSDSVGGDATAFANLWSSTEAGTGALAIVNAGAEEFNETVKQMADSAGSTEAAYDKMMGTFSEKVNRLKNTFANAGISIGSKFLPALGRIVDGITNWVTPAFQKFESYFDGVFGEDGSIDWNAFGRALRNMFRDAGAQLPTILAEFGGALYSAWQNILWPIIQGVCKAVFGVDMPEWSTVEAAITVWWTAYKEEANRIIRAVFGIEGGDTWEGVKSKFTGWWDSYKDLVKSILQATFGVEGGATWEDVKEKFVSYWNGIKDLVSNIFQAVFSISGGESWEIAKPKIEAWWNGIDSDVTDIMKATFGVNGGQAWESVKSVFEAWWNGIAATVEALFTAGWKLADGTLTWEDVQSIFSNWWGSIKDFVEALFQAGWQLAEGNQTWEAVFTIFNAWWNTIKDSVEALFTAGWKLANGTLTWEDVQSIFTNWWNSIKSSVESIFRATFGVDPPSIESVVASIQSWWNNVLSSISLGISARWNGILGGGTPSGFGRPGGAADPSPESGRSFANGLDFVERDGMLAKLHYGETVLNRTDAKTWRDGSGTGGMKELADRFDNMLNVMEKGFGNMNQQIVLDSGILVGQTVGMIDTQLGTMAGRKGRGV